jgi:hypothetical protein
MVEAWERLRRRKVSKMNVRRIVSMEAGADTHCE